MTIATPAALTVSLLRPLAGSESTYAPALLTRAESLLLAHIPDLLDRATDLEYRAKVVTIECDMVSRVLRNPDGILTESQGDYTYRLDQAVASGRLMPTPDELDALRDRARLSAATGALDGYARRRFNPNDPHPFLTGG